MSGTVGPGRPPMASRFQKGKSGNAKGRPRAKKQPGGSAFEVLIDKTLTVTQGGVERELTVEEALQQRTYQDALAGNRPARREILKMIARREQAIAARRGKVVEPVEQRMESVDPRNANEAMIVLGIASHDPSWAGENDDYERLLLEPWTVQAALSRRRGGKRLTEREISEIRRCTSDPETLRWPRGGDE